MLDTLIFDPSPCGFPKPRVPLLPTLDGISPWLTLGSGTSWASKGHFRYFSHSRYALHTAYRLAGIGPGATLLAPAYHCRTMLDPAIALGGGITLYPLHADLSPDVTAIQQLVNDSARPVKALLVSHFFGIPQDFAALADFCQQANIELIEDCSHVFFYECYRAPYTGLYGDFVTSSPYKFLPVPDGGLLYARNPARLADVSTKPASLAQELRGISDLVARARQHSRTKRSSVTSISARAVGAIPTGLDVHTRTSTSADYVPSQEGKSCLRTSRFLWHHAKAFEVTTRRRRHYSRWVEALAGTPRCRPLYPEPPADCVPYMFPLIIDHPDPQFYQLKQLGLPIWRWDSIVTSECKVARDYRTHLLHLPCHQSLSESEVEWMITVVRQVSNSRLSGAVP